MKGLFVAVEGLFVSSAAKEETTVASVAVQYELFPNLFPRSFVLFLKKILYQTSDPINCTVTQHAFHLPSKK